MMMPGSLYVIPRAPKRRAEYFKPRKSLKRADVNTLNDQLYKSALRHVTVRADNAESDTKKNQTIDTKWIPSSIPVSIAPPVEVPYLERQIPPTDAVDVPDTVDILDTVTNEKTSNMFINNG